MIKRMGRARYSVFKERQIAGQVYRQKSNISDRKAEVKGYFTDHDLPNRPSGKLRKIKDPALLVKPFFAPRVGNDATPIMWAHRVPGDAVPKDRRKLPFWTSGRRVRSQRKTMLRHPSSPRL
jgi:hypothetical protein